MGLKHYFFQCMYQQVGALLSSVQLLEESITYQVYLSCLPQKSFQNQKVTHPAVSCQCLSVFGGFASGHLSSIKGYMGVASKFLFFAFLLETGL